MVGVAPAIANGVFLAERLRAPPITPAKLL
jgi:CO/xanthine dehydrogenase Mo-binding subunit